MLKLRGKEINLQIKRRNNKPTNKSANLPTNKQIYRYIKNKKYKI